VTRRLAHNAALVALALCLGCTGAAPAQSGGAVANPAAKPPPLPATPPAAERPGQGPPASPTTANEKDPLRVLFVGNSYTMSHDLPGLVEQIAVAAASPRPLATHTVGFPGYSLEQHWERGDALLAIQQGPWDLVVLQDHSLQTISAPGALFEAARSFGAAINSAGAQALFFVTWARRDVPSMQDGITLAYSRAAAQVGGRLAPVGPAWQRSLAKRPALALHDDDGSHPSPAGTYLAACVFYSTLFGRPADGAEGLGFGELSQGQLASLQTTAWAVVVARASASGAEQQAPGP